MKLTKEQLAEINNKLCSIYAFAQMGIDGIEITKEDLKCIVECAQDIRDILEEAEKDE